MGRVFSDLKTAHYGAPGHPEAPFRVRDSHELLSAAGLAPAPPPTPAGPADVALLHGEGHLASVKAGTFDDGDTPAFPAWTSSP